MPAFARRSATHFGKRLDPRRIVRRLIVPIERALPSPTPATKHAPFRRTALFLLKPIPLVTKALDPRQHPLKQKLNRRSRYAGSLKLQKLSTRWIA
ncbi:hypothetical protein GWE18_15450 [Bradyrhizobium sp. CSA112]|uniref:hypothetical protein n=1 Tax=Bradyrhizobium sp. CSA112 TaxID=2699170 RepID=UPI0023B05548|nr:hypothetical protein [Bradyrhizobium sp. CSA112]MDE5454214.1 hypothetical protein [Bradyrhizobium sp. CSA112]